MFDFKTKIFIGSLSFVFILLMFLFYFEIQSLQDINIYPIELEQIEDGNYIGEAQSILIYAKVEVKISNHQIKEIHLINYRHSRGEKALEILDNIVAKNSINVDSISGSTASSIILRSAVSNALQKNNP